MSSPFTQWLNWHLVGGLCCNRKSYTAQIPGEPQLTRHLTDVEDQHVASSGLPSHLNHDWLAPITRASHPITNEMVRIQIAIRSRVTLHEASFTLFWLYLSPSVMCTPISAVSNIHNTAFSIKAEAGIGKIYFSLCSIRNILGTKTMLWFGTLLDPCGEITYIIIH